MSWGLGARGGTERVRGGSAERPASHDGLAEKQLEPPAQVGVAGRHLSGDGELSHLSLRLRKDTSHLQGAHGHRPSGLTFPDQEMTVVALPVLEFGLEKQSRGKASVWRKPSEKRARGGGVHMVKEKRPQEEQGPVTDCFTGVLGLL